MPMVPKALSPSPLPPTPAIWTPRRLARDRRAPAGFIEPCAPVLFDVAPSGPGMAPRGETRRLLDHRPQGWRRGAPVEPVGAGLEPDLRGDCRRRARATG